MNEKIIQKVYFDNAATTRIDETVLEAMLPYLTPHFSESSSDHYSGKEFKVAIKEARKKISALLNVRSDNIIFTSGGTESNDIAIYSALRYLGCNHIITSKIEHHSVLRPIETYSKKFDLGITYVKFGEGGAIDQNDLTRQLEMKTEQGKKCLVSLMHANNETGQFTEIRGVSNICKKYGAIFHSDCVQTIGHYPLNLYSDGVDMVSASAHKFHGPKEVGLLYVQEDLHDSLASKSVVLEKIDCESAKTVAGIVGMAEALDLSYQNFSQQQSYILSLKQYLATLLKRNFPGIVVNSGRFSLYSILSVSFPKTEQTNNLLTALNKKGICVSGGTACRDTTLHVIRELGKDKNFETVRFSFSKYNSKEEVVKVVELLKDILEINLPESKSLTAV